MNNVIKNVVTAFLFLLIFTTCSKSYDYYYITNHFVKTYYPYQNGQTILFENREGLKLVFAVENEPDIIHQSSRKSRVSEAKYETILRNKDLEVSLIASSGSIEEKYGNNVFSIEFRRNGSCLQEYRRLVMGDEKDCAASLGDTVRFNQDNVPIRQVALVKNKGLISFYNSVDSTSWNLIDNDIN